jgi:pimeloyl-ACP methyl ester carboxylesterase
MDRLTLSTARDASATPVLSGRSPGWRCSREILRRSPGSSSSTAWEPGASYPLPLHSLPPWESYAEELAAVLDEIGSEQAAIMAQLDAGPMGLFFAGTRPERTSALVLVNTMAKYVAADDYPIGVPPEAAETMVASISESFGSIYPVAGGDRREKVGIRRVGHEAASSCRGGEPGGRRGCVRPPPRGVGRS